MKSKQIYFILTLFIIVFCLVFMLTSSYDQYSEQKILRSANTELKANNIQISRLDTINIGLQEAEYNFRMYTSVWEKKYFIKYNQGIQRISSLLEDFSKKEVKGISSAISSDITKRNKQILLYTKLKKLTDSLLFVNLDIDTSQNAAGKFVSWAPAKKTVKKTVKTEEIKADTAPKKLKLFQRIKSAILNKNSKDSARIKTETTYGEEHAQDSYNKKQLRDIEKFYRDLFENQKDYHKRLTKKEQSILNLNERILNNIKLMFNEFSDKEHLVEASRKIELMDQTLHAIKVIDRSGKINFMGNLLLFSATILLLIKLYNAYNKILKSNKVASEQVMIKSRFFTSISHEMRTPLNAILGVTEQLKDTPLNQDQKSMTSLLETSSSMLLSAVNEILDFSRLETGKLSLSKTSFYYKNVLNDLVATITVLAKQKGLELKLDFDKETDVLLTGDPYRLRQIVLNLIANAVKFTDQGKINVSINLKITEAQARLIIQVKDTGVGISEKDLPFIFDEFSQVINNKRMDWQKGSGLGLPIVKKLVELHDGKITVSSIVDTGTVFNVELPYLLAKQDKPDLAANDTSALHTDAFKGIHLLVVDDAKMNLLVIEMIFRKLKISFDTATNGEDALEAFKNKHYDMVLTDIEMPGMDGVELTKLIRAYDDDKKSQVPIIAITGHISPDSHQYYLSSGLNDYIMKPFKEKELLEKILDYLN